MPESFDVIIIGSGAGGSAAAYSLVNAGQRVLLLEKGDHLPRDGSTLDVEQVFRQGRFRNQQAWVDRRKRALVPEEYYNVGGKTKWYGAALLRFSPHEFEQDAGFQCPGWPVDYAELEPWYAQAEALLGVKAFVNEPGLRKLIDRIVANGSGWRAEPLPLGLRKEILMNIPESKHFDGFASPGAYKSDAESILLAPIRDNPRFSLRVQKEVAGFLSDNDTPTHLTGVRCADGSEYRADKVVLAAGAMTSPRLLQDYLQQTGLNQTLPSAPLVGANFKLHINSVLLAFSHRRNHDVLRKTAIFFNDTFPHSTVQCLGWLDGDMLATQLPALVPRFVVNALGARVYGFFVTTEDGSSPENCIVSNTANGGAPVLDYALERIPVSRGEHRAITRAFGARLLRCGLFSVSRPMGLVGTAHALGSLVTGRDPGASVVDVNGKVHGFDNLYVADGSVLPRAGRVNPALTIYAWGLRLGQWLTKEAQT
ncbi:MAG: GMC family oxidoreductase [Thiogranum sp.]|nr:GMC family oxidoreductase [Thiogranum sp.]